MPTKLGFTAWIAAIMVGGVFVTIDSPLAYCQGDESGIESTPSSEGRSLGSTFQRIFGPRDKSSDSQKKRGAVPRGVSPGMKPGMFQGGIVKQLRGMSEESQEPEISVESTNTSNGEVFAAPIPSAPSQMAQRAPREPFTSDNASTQVARPSTSQRSAAGRDIFEDDPPSIVGTGVNPGNVGSADRQAPKIPESNYSLPPITKAQPRPSPNLIPSNNDASKVSTRPVVEEELPRVSRKSIPVSQSTTSSSTPSKNSYAIPNNLYTNTDEKSAAHSGSSRGVARSSPPAQVGLPPLSGNVSPPPSSNSQVKGVASTSQARSMPGSGETRLEMSVPRVKLFVSGPPSLQVGRAIPYEVLVRNEGTELLGGVIVSMTIPAGVKSSLPVATAGEFESEKDAAGVESMLWHVADLGPSQSRVFRVSLEATKAEHFGMDVEWTVLPQTGRVEVDVQQPQLNLALEGPSEVIWGKPEVYRLRVRNPGNSEAKDVEVRLTAEAYGSNQTKLGNIPAGSERIVEVELTFQHSGTIKIAGQAQSLVDSLDSNSSIDVIVKQVKLLAEWTSPSLQYQGSVAEYRMKLSNESSVPAQNVTCTTVVPTGLKVVSMPEGASLSGSEIRWSIPTIAASASSTFDFTFQAVEAGEIKLDSMIQSQGGGKATAEVAVKIESVSDLKLLVIDPIAPAPVGQDVVYDLTIVNRGSRTARAVKLLAQFSHGIEPIRTEGGVAQVLPGQVVFEPIESIEPGQEVTLRVVAQAAEPGMHRFRAELECEESETQLIQEETTRYLATSRSDSSNKATIQR